MQVNNSASNLKLAVETEIIKKSQNIVKNQIEYLLEKNIENSKAVEEEAKLTGAGNNLNIKA